MKVDGTPIIPGGGLKATLKGQMIARKSPEWGTDTLAVSDKGQFYQVLTQKVKELPEIRQDKVEALSGQISRGEFQIDAYRIAAGIIAEESAE